MSEAVLRTGMLHVVLYISCSNVADAAAGSTNDIPDSIPAQVKQAMSTGCSIPGAIMNHSNKVTEQHQETLVNIKYCQDTGSHQPAAQGRTATLPVERDY
jgi:hypothetical protein